MNIRINDKVILISNVDYEFEIDKNILCKIVDIDNEHFYIETKSYEKLGLYKHRFVKNTKLNRILYLNE